MENIPLLYRGISRRVLSHQIPSDQTPSGSQLIMKVHIFLSQNPLKAKRLVGGNRIFTIFCEISVFCAAGCICLRTQGL